jgi:hypothetical protein
LLSTLSAQPSNPTDLIPQSSCLICAAKSNAEREQLQILPTHPVNHHHQRVAKIDHLVQAIAEKSSIMALFSKTSQKLPSLDMSLGVLTIRIAPNYQHS